MNDRSLQKNNSSFLPRFNIRQTLCVTLCAIFALSATLLFPFSHAYIYIYIYVPPSSYPAKLEKTLNRKRGLRRDPGGRNSAGEFPRRCNDADYSPLLVHLSCKLLSARGPTVKFPQRATWPRPDQPLRVKFSASLFRWIGGSSERVEWDRGGGPYSARVLRTAYVIVASSFLFLLAVRPRRHSIHSNFNFGGSK